MTELVPLFFGPTAVSTAVHFYNLTTVFDVRSSALFSERIVDGKSQSLARCFFISSFDEGDHFSGTAFDDPDSAFPHLGLFDPSCAPTDYHLDPVRDITIPWRPDESGLAVPSSIFSAPDSELTFSHGTQLMSTDWAECALDDVRRSIERCDDYAGTFPVIDMATPLYAGLGAAFTAAVADAVGNGRSLFVTANLPPIPAAIQRARTRVPKSSFPLSAAASAAPAPSSGMVSEYDAVVIDFALAVVAAAAPNDLSVPGTSHALPTDAALLLTPSEWGGGWAADTRLANDSALCEDQQWLSAADGAADGGGILGQPFGAVNPGNGEDDDADGREMYDAIPSDKGAAAVAMGPPGATLRPSVPALRGPAARSLAGAVTAMALDSFLLPHRYFASTGGVQGARLDSLRRLAPSRAQRLLRAELAAPLHVPMGQPLSFAGVMAMNGPRSSTSFIPLSAGSRRWREGNVYRAHDTFTTHHIVVRGLPDALPLFPPSNAPPPNPDGTVAIPLPTTVHLGLPAAASREAPMELDIAAGASSRLDVLRAWHTAGLCPGDPTSVFDSSPPLVLTESFPRRLVLRSHGGPAAVKGGYPQLDIGRSSGGGVSVKVAAPEVDGGARIVLRDASDDATACDVRVPSAASGASAAADAAPAAARQRVPAHVAWPAMPLNVAGYMACPSSHPYSRASFGPVAEAASAATGTTLGTSAALANGWGYIGGSVVPEAAHVAALDALEEVQQLPVCARFGAAARSDGLYRRLAKRFKIPKTIHARRHQRIEVDDWREIGEALWGIADEMDDGSSDSELGC